MPAETLGAVCTIAVPDDLSSGLDTVFCKRLTDTLEKHPQSIRLDCSKLVRVYSSHIALLWRAHECCQEKSVELLLDNVNEGLVRSLEVLDLIQFFSLGTGVVRLEKSDRQRDLARTGAFHTVEFQPSVGGVDQASNNFLGFLETLRLTKETIFDMRTVFYEVATNIRSHAQLEGGEKINFSAELQGGELVMVFMDSGVEFNPLGQQGEVDPEQAAQNRQTRGFGLSLIKRMTDSLSYERQDGFNVLTLTRRYGAER